MMTSLLRARTALAVAALALAALVPALVPVGADAAGTPTLRVSPRGSYVGGQALTFSGSLGRSGRQRFVLQQHMGRPGDSWTTYEGMHWWTKSDGTFSFVFPAPAMMDLKLRVVSGKIVTPAWTAEPKSQDLTVGVSGLPLGGVSDVLTGVPFVLDVDTTPVLPWRPDLPPPVIKGRTLTLQVQGSDLRWRNLDTTTTDGLGNGSFTQTIQSPGPVNYRVREEDWTAGGNRIGWFPSFPITVQAYDVLPPLRARGTAAAPSGRATTAGSPVAAREYGGANTTASSVYKWGTPLWDFNWPYGESLTHKPSRGTLGRGWWLDTTTGLGRVSSHNGQLTLDSQRNPKGAGDFGTTAATLQNASAAYGRWETRFRLKQFETGAENYHARIELVPARASDDHCGSQVITVADILVGGSKLGIGVKSRSGKRWTATKDLRLGGGTAVFAVEVTRRHITWLVNGRPIGMVRSAAAVSDVPLTPRLSLVGNGSHEMNHTQILSDWERGWSLAHGKQVTRGAALRRSTFSGAC